MDDHRDQERATYRLCRAGFGFLSFALVIASLSTLLSLPRQFGGRDLIPGLRDTPFWQWIDAPVVWASLLGSYLLWGRWSEPGWQRRAGLLVVMSFADALLWLVEHGDALGLSAAEPGHLWVRYSFGQALGWAEFALITGLACELMAHLGLEQSTETGHSTRSLAAVGAVLWMLLFCYQTDWARGWPLEPRRVFNLEFSLLRHGSTMIWAVTLIQVTALSLATTQQCSQVLRDMDREDEHDDPLKSRSDPSHEGSESDLLVR